METFVLGFSTHGCLGEGAERNCLLYPHSVQWVYFPLVYAREDSDQSCVTFIKHPILSVPPFVLKPGPGWDGQDPFSFCPLCPLLSPNLSLPSFLSSLLLCFPFSFLHSFLPPCLHSFLLLTPSLLSFLYLFLSTYLPLFFPPFLFLFANMISPTLNCPSYFLLYQSQNLSHRL